MDSMSADFEIRVPSSAENLHMIRKFIGDVGEKAGLEPKEVHKLELAVDEACANVIEHAYGRDNTKKVSIRVTFDANSLRVDVIDNGKGFDPSAIEQAAVEKLLADRKSGGLGMRLMKKLMDEVHYEIIPGQKNELHMVKWLHKKENPA